MELNNPKFIRDNDTFLTIYGRNLLEELNIILPDKNGLTFLSELRKLPLHAKTPVIILTSNDYSQDRTVASELGVLDFIVKPMSMRTINSIMLDYIK